MQFASFDSADERQISYYVDEEEVRIAFPAKRGLPMSFVYLNLSIFRRRSAADQPVLTLQRLAIVTVL